jgi:tetratricopeptide (TPR) repeat protein
MPRVALIITVLTAILAASRAVPAAEPPQNQSMTIMGPANPQLSEGATELDAAGYSNLCAGYAMLKQWDEALQHCNTSLSIDPNNWRTFNNRAAVFVAKGDYELAMSDLRAGLEISPNSRTLLESLRIVQQNKRLMGTRSRSAVRAP